MSDLFEVLVAIAIISIGLLGGKKRKKPSSRPGTGASTHRTPETRVPARPRGQNTKISPEDIGRILGIELPTAAPTPEVEPITRRAPNPPVEPVSLSAWEAGLQRVDDRSAEAETGWDAGLHRSPETTETLEAAGGASHERFHHLYMEELSEPATVARIRPDLDEVRRAIIWKEILDTPVGMR